MWAREFKLICTMLLPSDVATRGMNKYVMLFVKYSSINAVDSCIAAAGLILAGLALRLFDLTKMLAA